MFGSHEDDFWLSVHACQELLRAERRYEEIERQCTWVESDSTWSVIALSPVYWRINRNKASWGSSSCDTRLVHENIHLEWQFFIVTFVYLVFSLLSTFQIDTNFFVTTTKMNFFCLNLNEQNLTILKFISLVLTHIRHNWDRRHLCWASHCNISLGLHRWESFVYKLWKIWAWATTLWLQRSKLPWRCRVSLVSPFEVLVDSLLPCTWNYKEQIFLFIHWKPLQAGHFLIKSNSTKLANWNIYEDQNITNETFNSNTSQNFLTVVPRTWFLEQRFSQAPTMYGVNLTQSVLERGNLACSRNKSVSRFWKLFRGRDTLPPTISPGQSNPVC